MRAARRGLFGVALAVVTIVGVVAPGTAGAVTLAGKQTILYKELASQPYFLDMYNHRTVAPNNSFTWSTDLCSWSPDKPVGVDFSMPCRRHDFNYRNFKANSIWNSTNKGKIDSAFLGDMNAVCSKASWYKKPTCYATAQTYYAAVRKFGT
jgi:hypothetical protein